MPLCMVDLAQTIEEWKDIQSVNIDDQVRRKIQKCDQLVINLNLR